MDQIQATKNAFVNLKVWFENFQENKDFNSFTNAIYSYGRFVGASNFQDFADEEMKKWIKDNKIHEILWAFKI